MSDTKMWAIEVLLSEDEDKTRADAILSFGNQRFHGWGRARRSPGDPEIPRIGEELATARALADLAHQLLEAASHGIETYEGHSIHLQA